MSAPWSALLEAQPLAHASDAAVLSDLKAEATATTIVCPLASQGVLTVSGPEAARFLQGQTTTDFREVSDGQSRLGCYVSLKGRAITSFRAVQRGEAIHLVMAADLLASVREKLAKFIVFSRAQVQVSAQQALIGVAGPGAATALARLGLVVPGAVDAVSHGEGLSLVRVHGEDAWLLLVAPEQLAPVWARLAEQAAQAGENAWRLRQIAAGVATVCLASSEAFQPQELNYPLLGGVSYSKGCYTGQEIVARLHFRGKLKQHVLRFETDAGALPPPTCPLVDANGRAAGNVVQAAERADGCLELLAIARPEQAGGLYLSDAQGPHLRALPLPYEVPAPE